MNRQDRYTLKLKTIWKLFGWLLIVGVPVIILNSLNHDGSLSILEWGALTTYPVLFFVIIFVVNTTRVVISQEGIQSSWYIGLGKVRLWESEKTKLQWSDISDVYRFNIGLGNIPPKYTVFFKGTFGNEITQIPIRSCYVGFEEALSYALNSAPKVAVKSEVWKILQRTEDDRNDSSRSRPTISEKQHSPQRAAL